MTDIKEISVTDYPTQYGEAEHVLVDVREADEFEAGHLAGAVNIPLSGFQGAYDQIPAGKTVVLICGRGGRSMMAAEFLKETGNYTDLVNLDGGTMGWIEAGNAVEK